jgi:hypothetical protein
MNTAGEVFSHTTWPRYRYVFVTGEGGIKKLVNVVRLKIKTPGGIMNYAILW